MSTNLDYTGPRAKQTNEMLTITYFFLTKFCDSFEQIFVLLVKFQEGHGPHITGSNSEEDTGPKRLLRCAKVELVLFAPQSRNKLLILFNKETSVVCYDSGRVLNVAKMCSRNILKVRGERTIVLFHKDVASIKY